MNILCNENVPLQSIALLRKIGYAVESIAPSSPGIPDSEVLQKAVDTSGFIITFDRDYGALIFQHRLPCPPGILYLRFTPTTPHEPAEYLIKLFERQDITLEGYFTVADREKIRQRKLP